MLIQTPPDVLCDRDIKTENPSRNVTETKDSPSVAKFPRSSIARTGLAPAGFAARPGYYFSLKSDDFAEDE
jgi:hypothetical protein